MEIKDLIVGQKYDFLVQERNRRWVVGSFNRIENDTLVINVKSSFLTHDFDNEFKYNLSDVLAIEEPKPVWEKKNIYVGHTGNTLRGCLVPCNLVKETKNTFTVQISRKGETINIQFNKSNMAERGAGIYSRFYFEYCKTPDEVAQWNEKAKNKNFREVVPYKICTKVAFNDVPDDELRKVWEILKPYVKE